MTEPSTLRVLSTPPDRFLTEGYRPDCRLSSVASIPHPLWVAESVGIG